MKSRKKKIYKNTLIDDSDKENDELRLHLTIAPDEEKEVVMRYLTENILSKNGSRVTGTNHDVQAKHLEEINQNVVIRSNGQKIYFSTLMRVLSIFDREDLNVVYQLVMDRFQDETPEGFDRVLWGDLMVNPDDENEFWNSQLDWIIVSWKKEVSFKKGSTDALKLESEEDSTMALELIRFIKKLLAELEPEEKGCRDLFNKGLTSDLPKEATKDPLEKSGTRVLPKALPATAPVYGGKSSQWLSYSESTEQETENMLRNTLMHTYTGRRSPGSSLFTSRFILEVGIGPVYISPPPYLASARLEHQALKEMKLDLHRRREVFTEDDGWDCTSDL
ncbi:hypothetical protein Tco_0633568 [Tanacetum coccineum]